MNRELLEQFYHASVEKCVEASKGPPYQQAWTFEKFFAQEVAEYCASICEELGTPVAGCAGNLTAMADDCADNIRKEFE